MAESAQDGTVELDSKKRRSEEEPGHSRKKAAGSFREKNDHLALSFGSKKHCRAVRSRQLNTIEGDSMNSDILDSIISTVEKSQSKQQNPSTSSTSSNNESISELLPPYNREANKPGDVYQVKEMIGEIQIEAMKDVQYVDEMMNATNEDLLKWRNENKYGYFVLNHIPMLPLDEMKRREAAAKLAYLDLLIKMYQSTGSLSKRNSIQHGFHFGMLFDIKRNPDFDKVPQCVRERLSEDFLVNSRSTAEGYNVYTLPKRMKDKLVLYILILCMHIDDYRLHITELMMDLKLERKKLTTYLTSIGSTVKKSTETVEGQKLETWVATIPIPLSFPHVRFMREGKR